MASQGVGRRIRVRLYQPKFICLTSKLYSLHARHRIGPILEAVMSAHTIISNNDIEEVRVVFGDILLSKMAG